jgi:hypothetical protein
MGSGARNRMSHDAHSTVCLADYWRDTAACLARVCCLGLHGAQRCRTEMDHYEGRPRSRCYDSKATLRGARRKRQSLYHWLSGRRLERLMRSFAATLRARPQVNAEADPSEGVRVSGRCVDNARSAYKQVRARRHSTTSIL